MQSPLADQAKAYELILKEQSFSPPEASALCEKIALLAPSREQPYQKWLLLATKLLLSLKEVSQPQVTQVEAALLHGLRTAMELEPQARMQMLRALFSPDSKFYRYNHLDRDFKQVLPDGLNFIVPEVGKEYDVAGPKLASVVPCAWTRCRVEAVNEEGTFTVRLYNGSQWTVRQGLFAPLGTRSLDFDWRMGLKEGDEIDVQDSKAVWYESTILRAFQRSGQKIVLVGYRVYRPEGDKQDEQGRTYQGWKSAYDQQFDVISPRIMPHKSMAKKLYTPASFPNSQITVDDSNDILFLEEYRACQFFSILRPNYSRSVTLIRLVNVFGRMGGFDLLLGWAEGASTASLVEVVRLLSGIHFIFPRMFVKQLVEKVVKATRTQLFDRKGFEQLSGQQAESLLEGLGDLYKRAYSLLEKYEFLTRMKQDLSVLLLAEGALVRQYLGLRLLSEAVRVKYEHVSEQEIAAGIRAWLKEKGLLARIFNEQCHVKLLQKSQQLFKYIAANHMMNAEFLQSLVQSPRFHQDARATLLKVLSESAYSLDQALRYVLVKKLLILPALDQAELSLLATLCNFETGVAPHEVVGRLVALLPGSKKQVQQKIVSFCGAYFKKLSQEQKLTLLPDICSRVDSKHSIAVLKHFFNSGQFSSSSFFTNFQELITQAKQTGLLAMLIESLNKNNEDHCEQVFSLLQLLSEHLNGSQTNALLQAVHARLGFQGVFLRWLPKVQSEVGFIKRLLQNCRAEELYLDNCFNALEYLFLSVNLREGRIWGQFKGKAHSAWVSNSPARELAGIKLLYNLFQIPAKFVCLDDLRQLLARTVINVRDQTLLRCNLEQAQSRFLSRAQTLLTKIERGEQPDQCALLLARQIQLLKSFNSMTETRGRADFVPQNCLLKKKQFKLTVTEGQSQKTTTLHVPHHLTLFQLRKTLAELFSLKKIQIFKGAQKLTPNFYGNSVGELKLQKIMVRKESEVEEASFPLLDPADQLEERVARVFKAEFAKYAEGGALLSKQGFDKFKQKGLGLPINSKSDAFFSEYAKKDSMTLEDFLQFYRKQAKTKPVSVVKNLYRLGCDCFLLREGDFPTGLGRLLLGRLDNITRLLAMSEKVRVGNLRQNLLSVVVRLPIPKQFHINNAAQLAQCSDGRLFYLAPLLITEVEQSKLAPSAIYEVLRRLISTDFAQLTSLQAKALGSLLDCQSKLIARGNAKLMQMLSQTQLKTNDQTDNQSTLQLGQPLKQDCCCPQKLLQLAAASLQANFSSSFSNVKLMQLFMSLCKLIVAVFTTFQLSMEPYLHLVELVLSNNKNVRKCSRLLVTSIVEKHPEASVIVLRSCQQSESSGPVLDILMHLTIAGSFSRQSKVSLFNRAVGQLCAFDGLDPTFSVQGWSKLALACGTALGKDMPTLPVDLLFKKYLFSPLVIDKTVLQQVIKSVKQSGNYVLPNYFLGEKEGRQYIYSLIKLQLQLSFDEGVFELFKEIECKTSGQAEEKVITVGLVNLGAVCYVNSILQALFLNPYFRRAILQAPSQGKVLPQLQHLFASLLFSKRKAVSPQSLLKSFSPPIDHMVQQDTSQFLNLLFDNLEKDLSGTSFARIVDDIYRGKLVTELICKGCKATREIQQPFSYYGVPVKNRKELCQAIEASQQGEIISDCYCEACGGKHQTLRRTLLKQAPRTLILALQRIVFDMDFLSNRKINTRLQFQLDLDIEPFTQRDIHRREQNQSEAGSGRQSKYELRAVVVHHGRAESGHYTVYLRSANSKHFVKADDTRVTIEMMAKFKSVCYGIEQSGFPGEEGRSTNAYVLFYDCKEQPADEPGIRIGDDCLKRVLADNHSLLTKLVLSNHEAKDLDFFNYYLSALEQRPGLTFQQRIQVLAWLHNFYQQFVQASNSARHSEFTKLACAFLKSQDLAQHFLQQSSKDIVALLVNKSKVVRASMGQQLAEAVYSVQKGRESIMPAVAQLIQSVVAQLNDQIAKNWKNSETVFQLLHRITADGSVMQEYINSDMAVRLMDFYLGKASPLTTPKPHLVGTDKNPPPFSKAILLIADIVRSTIRLGRAFSPQFKLFFLNNKFILQSLKHNFFQVKTIIAALSAANLEMSYLAASSLLEQLASSTEDFQICQILSALLQLCTIQDEFMPLRLKLILGTPCHYSNPKNPQPLKDLQADVLHYQSAGSEKPLLASLVDLSKTKSNFANEIFLKALSLVREFSVLNPFIGQYIRSLPGPFLHTPSFFSFLQHQLSHLVALKASKADTQFIQFILAVRACFQDPAAKAECWLVGEPVKSQQKTIYQGSDVRVVQTVYYTNNALTHQEPGRNIELPSKQAMLNLSPYSQVFNYIKKPAVAKKYTAKQFAQTYAPATQTESIVHFDDDCFGFLQDNDFFNDAVDEEPPAPVDTVSEVAPESESEGASTELFTQRGILIAQLRVLCQNPKSQGCLEVRIEQKEGLWTQPYWKFDLKGKLSKTVKITARRPVQQLELKVHVRESRPAKAEKGEVEASECNPTKAQQGPPPTKEEDDQLMSLLSVLEDKKASAEEEFMVPCEECGNMVQFVPCSKCKFCGTPLGG